jgi:hypothetical protein
MLEDQVSLGHGVLTDILVNTPWGYPDLLTRWYNSRLSGVSRLDTPVLMLGAGLGARR